jgi:Na+/H+ antiporter NhaD/arsenite permease-like protein
MLDVNLIIGALMLLILLAAFFLMARHNIPQALAMAMVACCFLALNPRFAREFLESGFREFAGIVVLFTAVAVPARMVERSGAFSALGAKLGQRIGIASIRRPQFALFLLVMVMIVSTYVTAALFHNITSILVMIPITIGLCSRYQIPSRWLLSGELVASNLGGFSSSWGDTPNIIEGRVWHLSNSHFIREIVPLNLLLVLVLIFVVALLTRWSFTANSDPVQMAAAFADFKAQEINIFVDRRLLAGGLATLAIFIVVQFQWRHLEIAAGAVTILAAIFFERKSERLKTLQSLEFDLYMVLAAIFVIAKSLDHSWVGEQLMGFVRLTDAQPWAIAISAYVGTSLTEAASWAAAVAEPIYKINPSHAAAWALGGGICAGSSSLVTAASAGIILSTQSRRYPGHEVSFRRYLAFGLPASLAMLAFYVIYFTFFG